MANKNLQAAKAAKNDEFYTRLEDINEELQHYREHFADKIVYLNCDDGEWSNFWRFFYANFGFFKLKRLIATSYHKDGGSYKYEYEGGYDQSDYVANNYMEGVVKTMLTGDGDFRSDECIEILKQADIVVTNPPFSLFREYIAQLMEYEKKFLILGNMNAITYKEVFPLIKNNKIWSGFGFNMSLVYKTPYANELVDNAKFVKSKGLNPEDGYIKVPACCWYTNLEHSKRHHPEEYYAQYSEKEYPKYDNYDAIEVSKVKNIPCDWRGIIGVPITYLDKFCPEQFEIIGAYNYTLDNEGKTWNAKINGEYVYKRILIRWKPEAMPTINDGVILYESRN